MKRHVAQAKRSEQGGGEGPRPVRGDAKDTGTSSGRNATQSTRKDLTPLPRLLGQHQEPASPASCAAWNVVTPRYLNFRSHFVLAESACSVKAG